MKPCPVCKGHTRVAMTRFDARKRNCYKCDYVFYTKEVVVDKDDFDKKNAEYIRTLPKRV